MYPPIKIIDVNAILTYLSGKCSLYGFAYGIDTLNYSFN